MLDMSSVQGSGVFLLLILISSIPAIAVLVWFRLARYPFSPLRYSVSLLAGAASFFIALFLQDLFLKYGLFRGTGKWGLFSEIFFRIAFTEELSRLILLALLFLAVRRLFSAPDISPVTIAGAAGLIAGLGFAILESSVYGASNPGNALLRAFTAAPLHGACGFRVGCSSIMLFRERPAAAITRFLTAVIIHGTYNFLLLIPGTLPTAAAVLISLLSLASSAVTIRNGMKGGNA